MQCMEPQADQNNEAISETIDPEHNSKTRKRKHESNQSDTGSSKPQPKIRSISSTRVANTVMKFRLGGNISDPLNLQGVNTRGEGDECSTCAPSPAVPDGQISPFPTHPQRDPLNLEGKGGAASNATHQWSHIQKKRSRQHHMISSKSEVSVEKEPKLVTRSKTFQKPVSKSTAFRYGNYNRYYGYRNIRPNEDDVRISLFKKEWFKEKDCLDIGCNTGQVTMMIARDFKPSLIVGIDIDPKLVEMAWKNLHRQQVSTVAPDGRPFPQSLLISHCLPGLLTVHDDVRGANISIAKEFPYNIKFKECNYVPVDDAVARTQEPEYDVILALSLTKWIHLNWGDNGIKRFFQRIYNHLRPGGKLVLEPQPYATYSKRKKLTTEMYENYQEISFFPRDFQSYLMSSEVGFTEHKLIGVPDHQSKGFRRSLHLYTKSSLPDCDKNCEDEHYPPTSSSITK